MSELKIGPKGKAEMYLPRIIASVHRRVKRVGWTSNRRFSSFGIPNPEYDSLPYRADNSRCGVSDRGVSDRDFYCTRSIDWSPASTGRE